MSFRKIIIFIAASIIVLVLMTTSKSPALPANAQGDYPDFDSSVMPVWSPDGEYILAVWSTDLTNLPEQNKSDIWRIDADDYETTRLTHNNIPIQWAKWSPDSNWIAYTSTDDREYPLLYDLWLIDSNGGQSKNLTSELDGDVSTFQWSPDSKSILFTLTGTDPLSRKGTIWIADLETSELTEISPNAAAEYHSPDWSHDGSKIVFVSSDEDDNSLIWIVDYEDDNISSPRNISIDDIEDETAILEVYWSPVEDLVVVSMINRSAADIGIVNLDGRMTILTESLPEINYVPRWSPNGNHLAFISILEFNNFDIFLIDAKTGELSNLTGELNDGVDRIFSWAPDSQRIAFESDMSGEMGLWIIDITSGELTQVPVDFAALE